MYSMSWLCSCLTCSASAPVAGRFGEFAALVGRVGDDLAAQHVQHLVEAGAGIDRHGQREHALAEVLADLRQRLVEIRLLLVERVDDDHLRDAVLRGVFPDRVRADARRRGWRARPPRAKSLTRSAPRASLMKSA